MEGGICWDPSRTGFGIAGESVEDILRLTRVGIRPPVSGGCRPHRRSLVGNGQEGFKARVPRIYSKSIKTRLISQARCSIPPSCRVEHEGMSDSQTAEKPPLARLNLYICFVRQIAHRFGSTAPEPTSSAPELPASRRRARLLSAPFRRSPLETLASTSSPAPSLRDADLVFLYCTLTGQDGHPPASILSRRWARGFRSNYRLSNTEIARNGAVNATRRRAQASRLGAERVRARAMPLWSGTVRVVGFRRGVRACRSSSRSEVRNSRTAFRSELAISGRGFVCMVSSVIVRRENNREETAHGAPCSLARTFSARR